MNNFLGHVDVCVDGCVYECAPSQSNLFHSIKCRAALFFVNMLIIKAKLHVVYYYFIIYCY